MIFMEKKVVRSLYTMEHACLVCRSSEYLTQGCGGLSLFHRWSLIRPYPVRRGKGSAVASLSLSHRWSLIRLHLVRRGKGGSASFLCSTAPRQHVSICGTRRSL